MIRALCALFVVLILGCPAPPLAKPCKNNSDCPEDAFCDPQDKYCVAYGPTTGRCGDNTVNFVNGEQCDDGNTQNDDGCSKRCQIEASVNCGDGWVDLEDGEQCDDGLQCDNGMFCLRNSHCRGIQSGLCLQRSGDGCSNTCQLERPGTCFNNALFFDGIDDTCEIADEESMDLLVQLTLEAWILPLQETLESYRYIISHGDSNNGYALGLNSGRLDLRIMDGESQHSLLAPRSATLLADRWYHVAGTYDGHTMRLFVDGRLHAERPQEGLTSSDYEGPLRLGSAASQQRYFFAGLIDEVRISRRARYTQEQPPPAFFFVADPQTVALWHLDEAAGQTILDETGALSGTLGHTAESEEQDPQRQATPCIPERRYNPIVDAGPADVEPSDTRGPADIMADLPDHVDPPDAVTDIVLTDSVLTDTDLADRTDAGSADRPDATAMDSAVPEDGSSEDGANLDSTAEDHIAEDGSSEDASAADARAEDVPPGEDSSATDRANED